MWSGTKKRSAFLLGWTGIMIPKEQAGTVEETLVSNAKVQTDLNLWHQQLSHVNEHQLRQAIKRNQLHGVKISDKDSLKFCIRCEEAKMCRQSNKFMDKIYFTYPGQLIHSDLCGPMPERIGGSKYFVTFIDDFSRWVKVYFLRKKNKIQGI